MKQLLLGVQREITVSSFCLIIRACWSVKWKLFWSSESQQEANTLPWADWKSEIQTLEQLLDKGIVLETVTDCLELEKKLSHMTTPAQVPDTSPVSSLIKPGENRENFLKLSLDNKITSNFPQTTKNTSINLYSDRLFLGIFVNGLGNYN